MPTLIGVLGRLGRPAWELLIGVDTFRVSGWRYVRQHRWDNARVAAQGQQPRDAVYRAIWADAAAEVGAELHELAPGIFELSSGAARTRVLHQKVSLDDIVSFDVALNKTLVNRLLNAAGLPVSEYLEFSLSQFEQAAAFLASRPGPCVVKPTAGAGGASVTAGIRNRAQLLRATLKAVRFYPRLLIERQAAGDAYRLLFLDGQLLDVVRRLPPRVVGDGRSTIAELIAAENRTRLAANGACGLSLLRIDLDCSFTLEHAGLSIEDVPPADMSVVVKTVTNQNSPQDNETVVEGVSTELIAAAASAARQIGVRLAGVDVITADPGRPLGESGGVILEVNSAPGLHHHYHVAKPERATRVAVPVLKKLLQEATLG